uniref:Uncharacterized protein n=1 Tax=Anguilla anguilla TaxID=7936 RepID=A0A0E9TTF3_ANGAN
MTQQDLPTPLSLLKQLLTENNGLNIRTLKTKVAVDDKED